MENKQLTANFWLYEFINAKMPMLARDMNWRNIDQFDPDKAQEMADFLQQKRNHINSVYQVKNEGKSISLIITSGWRCAEWELYKKRTGTGAHTIMAADVVPWNCSIKLAFEILNFLYAKDWPRKTGHQGGFAKGRPSYNEDGSMKTVGFLHYDFQTVRRWFYPK